MFYIHQEARGELDQGNSRLLGSLCSDAWRPRGLVNSINAFIIQELLTPSSHMGLVVMVALAIDNVPMQTMYGMCGYSTTWAAFISCRFGGSGLWPSKAFPLGFALLPVICLSCTAVGGIDCHYRFWNGEVEIPVVWLMQHPCNTGGIEHQWLIIESYASELKASASKGFEL